MWGRICDSFRLSNNSSQDITTRSNIREVPYMETVHLKFLTTIILEMKAPILMQHLNKGLFSQLLSRQNVDIFRRNGTLLQKLFWPTVRRSCFSDGEKLLKYEAEGQEFAKCLRSLEQFIQTVKGQDNLWWQNAFSTCSWSVLRSNKLDQLEFKLEKAIGI